MCPGSLSLESPPTNQCQFFLSRMTHLFVPNIFLPLIASLRAASLLVIVMRLPWSRVIQIESRMFEALPYVLVYRRSRRVTHEPTSHGTNLKIRLLQRSGFLMSNYIVLTPGEFVWLITVVFNLPSWSVN